MMECSQITTLLARWEQNEPITPVELEALQDHLDHCSSCKQRFGPLLPLLQRDAGRLSKIPLPMDARNGPTTEPMADSIMTMVDTMAITGRDQSLGRFMPWVAAAALLLLLPFGALLFTTRASDVVTVRFVLEAPGATTVVVSGNFNQWSGIDIPLKRDSDGKTWSATVKLKRSFAYRYNFVIDNQIWIEDPNAAISNDDGFGGRVSLLDL